MIETDQAMRRPYDNACPVARTLNVIGERWTVLILRELFRHGDRRFQDLRGALAAIPPTTLSARLKTLESSGVLTRHSYSDHPPRMVYRLTAKGRALGPILLAMKDWGERFAAKTT